MNHHDRDPATAATGWACVLPRELLAMPLARLGLSQASVDACRRGGLTTVHDALASTSATLRGLGDGHLTAVHQAVSRLLHDGLARHASAAEDWPALRRQLVAGLAADEVRTFARVVGLDAPPPSRLALAAELHLAPARLDALVERVRTRVAAAAPTLLARLQREATSALAAGDGTLQIDQAPPDTLLRALADQAPDRELGLRLLAFLLPHECCHHAGTLLGVPMRVLRRLLRALPPLVAPHRLPLHLDWIRHELEPICEPVPRGVLLHVLRTELRVAIEHDAHLGDVVAPDPRTPEARLVELLQEARRPLPITDLLFAWRERFRTGSLGSLSRWLRTSDAFVRVGHDLWALRSDHSLGLGETTTLADRVARRIVAEGGRNHVADLLAADERDERTVHYVLDHLAHDPRVRMLGRGDACAASHRRSAVLESLLGDLRRAAGEVVVSRFLQNQPPERRRLVARLLRDNRLFVQPGPDRVDTITNWPFNDERLQRLLAIADNHLRSRAGYASGDVLRDLMRRSDLGGEWLTTAVLLDVLRRHGPFEVLPGGIVAHADTALGSALLRSVRQALRASGVPLSVDDLVRARPELGEFAPMLAELLAGNPHVRSADGVHFSLA